MARRSPTSCLGSVGRRRDLRQAVGNIAEHQRQHNAPGVERQAVKTGHQRRPCLAQGFGQFRKLGPLRVQLGQVGGTKRMLFDRHVMQPLRPLRIGAPCLPGCEEIQAEPEARFDECETAPFAPARGQSVPI